MGGLQQLSDNSVNSIVISNAILRTVYNDLSLHTALLYCTSLHTLEALQPYSGYQLRLLCQSSVKIAGIEYRQANRGDNQQRVIAYTVRINSHLLVWNDYLKTKSIIHRTCMYNVGNWLYVVEQRNNYYIRCIGLAKIQFQLSAIHSLKNKQ